MPKHQQPVWHLIVHIPNNDKTTFNIVIPECTWSTTQKPCPLWRFIVQNQTLHQALRACIGGIKLGFMTAECSKFKDFISIPKLSTLKISPKSTHTFWVILCTDIQPNIQCTNEPTQSHYPRLRLGMKNSKYTYNDNGNNDDNDNNNINNFTGWMFFL